VSIGAWLRVALPVSLLIAAGALWLRAGPASGNVPPTELDVTGTWNVAFEGSFEFDCEVEFVQDGDDLDGTYVCPDVTDGDFSGTIKQSGEDVIFNLDINAFGSSVELNGVLASDGNSANGTWAFGINEGTFTSTRKGAPTPAPTATPTLAPVATNTPPSATNTPPSVTATATKPPTVAPTAAHTPTPSGLSGDVNCAGGVNSVDATLTLQRGAGLIASLVCEANADVNEDGTVNSLDAALILQFVAGLLGALPV
jgi:hypothetical protein